MIDWHLWKFGGKRVSLESYKDTDCQKMVHFFWGERKKNRGRRGGDTEEKVVYKCKK